MIEVSNLSVQAGQFRLSDVSFTVPEGGYGVLMGKTGSGKSTILEAVAGLKAITGGRIVLHGRDVTRLKPAEREIGYVPQDGALFHTMTVRDHLAFALAIRKFSRRQIDARVLELADWLEIPHLLKRYPTKLSGGEKQRVAIGRALSFRPRTLLLDEPLSALDEKTRQHMFEVLQRVRDHSGVTVLHVTHNYTEAEILGDCLLQIHHGKVIPLSDVRAPSYTADEPSHLLDLASAEQMISPPSGSARRAK